MKYIKAAQRKTGIMFLLATMAMMCLLLREGKSQAVGKGMEDVWVDGKLGGKVEVAQLDDLFYCYLNFCKDHLFPNP